MSDLGRVGGCDVLTGLVLDRHLGRDRANIVTLTKVRPLVVLRVIADHLPSRIVESFVVAVGLADRFALRQPRTPTPPLVVGRPIPAGLPVAACRQVDHARRASR